MSNHEWSPVAMGAEKVLCYISMGVAAIVALIFLLDATIGLLGGVSLVFDILFIVGALLVLWQAIETSRELR